jgi:hypothetical protein
MHEASCALTHRDELVDAAAALMETKLRLAGVTAIEDRCVDMHVFVYVVCFFVYVCACY